MSLSDWATRAAAADLVAANQGRLKEWHEDRHFASNLTALWPSSGAARAESLLNERLNINPGLLGATVSTLAGFHESTMFVCVAGLGRSTLSSFKPATHERFIQGLKFPAHAQVSCRLWAKGLGSKIQGGGKESQ